MEFDDYSRSIRLLRDLSSPLLTGSEKLLGLQLDTTQTLVFSGSQQLKTTLAEIAATREAAQWPETMRICLQGALNLTQDFLHATTVYQLESMRLLQEQGAATQQTIANALRDQFVIAEKTALGHKSQTQQRRHSA
jgi:hypothetical protein